MRIHQRCFGWRLVAVRLCTRRVRNSHAVGYTTDVPSSPSSQPQPSPSEFGSAGGEVSKHKKCAGAEARRKTRIFCRLRVGYEFHFVDILPTPSSRRPDVGHIPTHHKPHNYTLHTGLPFLSGKIRSYQARNKDMNIDYVP